MRSKLSYFRFTSRVLLTGAAFVFAAAGQQIEFNRDIRPILSDRCFSCHGPDLSHRQAGIRFDIPSAGPKDPEEIVRRVTAPDSHRMPPASSGKARLNPRELDLIKRWVAQGQPWQPFWSFIPPRRPPLPLPAKNPIDSFIQARLEREGLHPSPEADKRIL